MSYADLYQRLTQGQLAILDGGTGTELERRGVPMDSQAWCGTAAADHLDVLQQIHTDYLMAGASIITTNTYASSRLLLEPAGFGDQFRSLNSSTVKAAHLARSASKHQGILVAGSLSHRVPIAEGMAQASLDNAPPANVLAAAFDEMGQLLSDEHCDLILLEMMFHPARMQAAFEAAKKTALPIWAGFSARRGSKGEVLSFTADADIPFENTVEILQDYDVDAAGIMHTSPDLIEDALAIIRKQFDGPLMAYPDSGYFVSPHWQFEDVISPQALLTFAKHWVNDCGVQILGGCCGLSPEHIEAYRPLVQARNNTLPNIHKK